MATSTNPKDRVRFDSQLAAGMVLAPLYTHKGGIESMLKTVTTSGDPADALAHLLFTLFSNARNALLKNGIPIDNRAWLAKGGAVDVVIKDVLGIIASTAGTQLASSAFARDVKADLVKIMKQEMSGARQADKPQPMIPGGGGAPLPQGRAMPIGAGGMPNG